MKFEYFILGYLLIVIVGLFIYSIFQDDNYRGPKVNRCSRCGNRYDNK